MRATADYDSLRKATRLSHFAADDAGVVATEAEAVIHGRVDCSFNRLERRVV